MRIALPGTGWVELEIAGFGSRALAYVMDFCLRWLIVGLVAVIGLYVYSIIGDAEGFIHSLVPQNVKLNSDSFDALKGIVAVFFAFIFLIEFGYPLYFEVVHQGVTPGKRLFGLRVVDERGLPVGFQASALRTLLLIVDIMPVFGFVGLVSMLLSKNSQRLGDLVAQTLVIYDEKTISDVTDTLRNRRISDLNFELPLEHYNLLEKYIQRRGALAQQASKRMQEGMLEALRPHIDESKDVLDKSQYSSDDELLEWIYSHATPVKNTLS